MRKIYEDIEPVVEPLIVHIFEILNEEKKLHKTKVSLLNKIKSLLPYLGLPAIYAQYILEIYLLNYRKDGNYSSLTKENIVDPREGYGSKIKNDDSKKYTFAKLPFKGSNLEAFWSKDRNMIPFYQVISYKWYPIYIYKEGKWYKAVNSYSKTTANHMNRSYPIFWDGNIGERVIYVDKDEMLGLTQNLTFEDLRKIKVKKIQERISDLISKRVQTLSFHVPTGGFIEVKFKIKDIKINENQAVFVVDIYNVMKFDNWKPTTQNYLKGEIPGIDREYVEIEIINKLERKLNPYIGPQLYYREHPNELHNITFEFNHLKK